MAKTIFKHLPWVAPTVAILAVGSDFMDRINISFDGETRQTAQADELIVEVPMDLTTAFVEPGTAITPTGMPENVQANWHTC